jgi:flagellar biogenesis protein FliO
MAIDKKNVRMLLALIFAILLVLLAGWLFKQQKP